MKFLGIEITEATTVNDIDWFLFDRDRDQVHEFGDYYDPMLWHWLDLVAEAEEQGKIK